MERKGFTLIELLVVIAIIALLMGILMPALVRVRLLAQRVVCGANLKGIGTSMAIYASDYEDEYPRYYVDGTTISSPIYASDYNDKYPRFAANDTGDRTISSSLYLLVKYGDMSTKSFICKSDPLRGKAFEPIEDVAYYDDFEFPVEECSYSYHQPYYVYALSPLSDSGMALLGDRNPGNDIFLNDRIGNSFSHQEEGQNVLFNDIHLEFTKKPDCGVRGDNIYTSNGATTAAGIDTVPAGLKDSVLVSDKVGGGGGEKPPRP